MPLSIEALAAGRTSQVDELWTPGFPTPPPFSSKKAKSCWCWLLFSDGGCEKVENLMTEMKNEKKLLTGCLEASSQHPCV